MTADPWPFVTPGIPDGLFERLPGIPLTQRETRLLMLSYLRLGPDSCLWDVGAGTGTIAVEAARLAKRGQVIAVERDEEVVDLIQRNCDRFGVKNVQIVAGSAPDCFPQLCRTPQRICLEGGARLRKFCCKRGSILRPVVAWWRSPAV